MGKSINKYRLNFYISGVADGHLGSLDLQDVEIMRQGDIANKRTGRKFDENVVKKTVFTTYEEGFSPAIDKMIQFVKSNNLLQLTQEAKAVSLQVCVDLDDENNVPYIGFTNEQMSFLVDIGSEIEMHIS